MPRVRFDNVDLEVEVEAGSTLLEAARAAGAPVGSHCGGVCACSTCHVYLAEGDVTEMGEEEHDMLELGASAREPRSRLSCQTRVRGRCVVEITDESFRAYLDDHPDDRARAMKLWRR